jgi:hypothetical protein
MDQPYLNGFFDSLIAHFYYFFPLLMWINYPGSFENKLKDALNNNYTEFALTITEEKYMITSNKLLILLS